jgi:hypothetical protein
MGSPADDDFDREFGEDPASDVPAPAATDFDREFGDDASPANGSEAEQARVTLPEQTIEPGQSWTDKLRGVASGAGDLALGFGEGASLGFGEKLGALGASLADANVDAYDYLTGSPAAGATKVGRTAADMGREDSARAQQTDLGKLGKLLGALNTSAAAAGAGAAGAAGQAGMGAALGGLSEASEDDATWLSILLNSGLGAGMGAVGGYGGQKISELGKRLAVPRAMPRTAPAPKQSPQLDLFGRAQPPALPPRPGPSPLDDLIAQAAEKRPKGLEALAHPYNAAIYGVGEKLLPHVPKIAKYADRAGRAITVAAPYAASFTQYAKPLGDLAEKGARAGLRAVIGKASAQEKAYAGAPTTSWAVQSVLASGQSGLPPEDEQRLTDAVMSGDDQRVASASFVLGQRHPGYEKRLQDEYRSLQESE